MRTSLLSLALAFILILSTLGCKDELIQTQTPGQVELITLDEAKIYYNQTPFAVRKPSNVMEGQLARASLQRIPIWGKATKKKAENYDILVVPILHDKLAGLSLRQGGQPKLTSVMNKQKDLTLNQTSFFYFYKDEKAKVVCEVVTFIGDNNWLTDRDKPFSGRIIVEDENMSLKQGITFKNGIVTERFTKRKNNSNARESEVNSIKTVCYIQEFWQVAFTIDVNGNITSEIYRTHLRDELLWCELEPVISGGQILWCAPNLGPAAKLDNGLTLDPYEGQNQTQVHG
jgi:hypothetical protein